MEEMRDMVMLVEGKVDGEISRESQRTGFFPLADVDEFLSTQKLIEIKTGYK
jgi:hypothetical protein